MTKYFCDICEKQIYSPNQVNTLIGVNNYISIDLCSECCGAINKAKDEAEIETFRKLREKNEPN